MFKFAENDIVVFHKAPTKLFIVTTGASGVYLTAGDNHSSLSYYTEAYGNNYTVFRAFTTANVAMLKRIHGVDTTFKIDEPPCYMMKVHSTIKEYTMDELEKIVGHPFKLVK